MVLPLGSYHVKCYDMNIYCYVRRLEGLKIKKDDGGMIQGMV